MYIDDMPTQYRHVSRSYSAVKSHPEDPMPTGHLLAASLPIGIAVIGAVGQSLPRTLRRVAEFDLPGPSGNRFDYLTIDLNDDYLISAQLGAGRRT